MWAQHVCSAGNVTSCPSRSSTSTQARAASGKRVSPTQVTKSAILTRLRASRPSACQLKRDRACLVGPFDDHGFAADTSVGSGAADDRRELARRRRVEELDRDLTPREEKRDVTGRLRRCQARERADTAVVADLLAFRVEQRVGDNPLVTQTGPLLTEVDFHIVECQRELDRLRRSRARTRA